MSVEQTQATETTIDDIIPANPRREHARDVFIAHALGARQGAIETLGENPTREEAIKAIDPTVTTIFAELDDNYIITTDIGTDLGEEKIMLAALEDRYFAAVNN
jgi:hypothetical protein